MSERSRKHLNGISALTTIALPGLPRHVSLLRRSLDVPYQERPAQARCRWPDNHGRQGQDCELQRQASRCLEEWITCGLFETRMCARKSRYYIVCGTVKTIKLDFPEQYEGSLNICFRDNAWVVQTSPTRLRQPGSCTFVNGCERLWGMASLLSVLGSAFGMDWACME